MQDLSPQPQIRTQAPYSGSVESGPLDHQEVPKSLGLNAHGGPRDTILSHSRNRSRVLFAIVKTWKHPDCPLLDEEVKKVLYVHVHAHTQIDF